MTAITLPLDAVEKLLDVASNAASSMETRLSDDEWSALDIIRREVEAVKTMAPRPSGNVPH